MLPYKTIEHRLKETVRNLWPDAPLDSLVVRPCPDPKFGDYQTSGLMALAKARKASPRQLASEVVARLQLDDLCEPVEIAGAGFLNFRLKREALGSLLQEVLSGGPLFFQPAAEAQTIVLDFSGPNVAKPMHVGHIRSTILGDSLARLLRLLGHQVITDNHIGDWGTQFGKLLVGWKSQLNREQLAADPISEMERLYKQVNSACESDPAVLEQAREELVKLQSGDAENLAIWKEMIALSQRQFETIYGRLGIQFDHSLGESFYNPRLKSVVEELSAGGLAQESEGAKVVFFEEPQLKGTPAIVQKSDGAANYTTTDLATLAYRWETWHPQQIVYVTDARQQLHFQQVFTIFRRWKPEASARLAHVWFGSILGEDGKPFKTRTGETVRLADLLDEAEERAFAAVSEKNPDLPEYDRKEIARAVGIGAVKYADLSQNRQSDYVFSWSKMLALNGNTAPYLQYAYTRIRSIFRKAGLQVGLVTPVQSLGLTKPEEIRLAKHLLNFGLTLELAAEDFRPNFICSYLYELAGYFAGFYENCPVLQASETEKMARLALCELTARVLKQGLEILGIETLEQM